MQMTTDARAWLASTVRRILDRQSLADAERAGTTYELMSHLHAAGEARAAAAGRSEVTREDLETALAEAGGEDGLAAAFVQPLAKPAERVLVGRRLFAFAIDALLLGIVISFVHGLLVFLLEPFTGGPGSAADFPFDVGFWWWLMPWGFHDPALPLALQALIALASAATVLGYFTWSEAQQGRTLGKLALNLRVRHLDGRPITYRDSFIRNCVKVVPPLLFLDTLAMLIAFGDDKQRVSDKIAKTVVIRV